MKRFNEYTQVSNQELQELKKALDTIYDISDELFLTKRDQPEFYPTYMENYSIIDKMFKKDGYKVYRISIYKSGELSIGYVKREKVTFPAGTKLWHVGGRKTNILRSSFTSRDFALYSGSRIYFTTEGHIYGDSDRVTTEYTCTGNETIYIDYEQWSEEHPDEWCVYIENSNPFTLPVRVIKEWG